MKIEEMVVFAELFDIYGKLLSKKQFELLSEFLNFNLSESELAEMFGSSRQSVHDAISKAKKQLIEFEESCGILKTKNQCKEKLINLRSVLNENKKAQSLIDDIIENF